MNCAKTKKDSSWIWTNIENETLVTFANWVWNAKPCQCLKKLNSDTQNKTAQMATKVIKKLKAPATTFTVEYCMLVVRCRLQNFIFALKFWLRYHVKRIGHKLQQHDLFSGSSNIIKTFMKVQLQPISLLATLGFIFQLQELPATRGTGLLSTRSKCFVV